MNSANSENIVSLHLHVKCLAVAIQMIPSQLILQDSDSGLLDEMVAADDIGVGRI